MKPLDELYQSREPEYIPIKVTSQVILHIGAGIYSSVAGAIKELVSNAYDADATRVIISTGYPNFEEIKVVDNGMGMTPGDFREAMQSIGNSLKGISNPSRLTSKFKRPIIGHLGIGLMALSQVCDLATIESQMSGTETKFVADLDFSQFRHKRTEQTKAAKAEIIRNTVKPYGGVKGLKKHLANLDPKSDEYVELQTRLEIALKGEEYSTQLQAEGIDSDLEDEQLGYCVIYSDLPAIPGRRGTTITLHNVDQGVKSTLTDLGRSPNGMPQNYRDRDIDWTTYRDEINKWSWEELCERLQFARSHFSYEALPKYHQFLWELAIMTPVEYLPHGPITILPEVLEDQKNKLKDFNFSVIVDNHRLLKPILLPAGIVVQQEKLEPEFDYTLEMINFDEIIDGERLKFRGYVFWQKKQITPSSLRGLQIYIRNVGIGLYDRTLIGFANVNPSSRGGQMSGEIYVDAGLERALNVDRNSFRETDPHYVKLREYLWKLLGSTTKGDGIIGRSVDAYWKRKARQDEELYEEHIEELREVVRQVSHGRFDLKISESEQEEIEPYIVKKDQIRVYENSRAWPRSNAERRLYQRLLIPIKVAVANGASAEDILVLLEKMLLRQ